jgi:hypothetical protein
LRTVLYRRYTFWLLFATASLGLYRASHGQRPSIQPNYGATAAPPAGAPIMAAPPMTATPSPGVSLGPGLQPFDPYASPTVAAPGLDPWAAPPTTPPPWSTPTTPMPLPNAGVPDPAAIPPVLPPTTPVPGTPAPSSGYPAPITPQPLFSSEPFASGSGPPYQRLFENTGFRYTYVWGSSGEQLQMHEIDLSTTAVFPGFLHTAYNLRVSPGFTLLLVNGPWDPARADLPPQLYSAYIDGWWNPQITPQLSAELSVRTGVYSDFQSFTTDSLRLIGAGVGILQVTPAIALKLGVAYLDRNDVKLLPAGGVLWQPNENTRWDIFFPAPKLAHRWKNVRNAEVWWYLGGEYGGGAWTIERRSPPDQGATERIDINDIRVFLGTEFFNLNRYYGFAEIGYVFNRELLFFKVPSDSLDLDDTFMLRGGFSF